MHPHVGQHRAYAVLRLVVSILLGHYEAQKLRRERTGRQRSEGAYLLRQRVAEDIPVIPAFDNKPSEVIHVALRAGGDVSDKSEGLLPRQEPGPFGYFRHIFDGMVDNSVETHLSLRLTDTALFQTALLRGSILSGAVYGATSLLAVFRRSAVRVLLLALTRHLPAVVQEVLLALKVLHHLAVEFHVGTLWFHASKLQKNSDIRNSRFQINSLKIRRLRVSIPLLGKPYLGPPDAFRQTYEVRVGDFVFSTFGVEYGLSETSRLGTFFINRIEAPLVMEHLDDRAPAVDEDIDVVAVAGIAAHLLAYGGGHAHVAAAKVRPAVEDIEPQVIRQLKHNAGLIMSMNSASRSTSMPLRSKSSPFSNSMRTLARPADLRDAGDGMSVTSISTMPSGAWSRRGREWPLRFLQ